MRSFAILWFGASIALAPILMLSSLVGLVWSQTGNREHTKAFLVVGGTGIVLLSGYPVWLTQYAQ